MGEEIKPGDTIRVKDGIEVGDITAPSAKIEKRRLLDADILVNIHGEKFEVVEVDEDRVLIEDKDKAILQKLKLKSDRFVLDKKYVKKV
jgi:hypothetical protein